MTAILFAAAFFALQNHASGTAPEIEVEQPEGTGLVDGVSTVSLGNRELDVPVSLTFAILNTGDANLTGVAATIDGANAADFEITLAPETSLIPLYTTQLTVRFTPSTTGTRTAALHIASNDANENPFDITLTGTGVLAPGPEIRVEQPTGVVLQSGRGNTDFGITAVGTGAPLSFTITNRGASPLTGVLATIDGPGASSFSISTPPDSSMASQASTVMQVIFTPNAVNNFRAYLHIASNDADENPFDIELMGAGADANSDALWITYSERGPEDDVFPKGLVVTSQGDTIVAQVVSFYDEALGERVVNTRLEKRSSANGSLIDSVEILGFETRSMIVCPDGNVALAGRTWTTGPELNQLTVRKHSSATLANMWVFNRDGPGVNSWSSDRDAADAMVFDADGNVIVMGQSEESDSTKGVVLKLDGITGMQIGNPYLSAPEYRFESITTSAAGGVFVAGGGKLTRLNTTLNEVWVSQSNALYSKMITDADGNLIACGGSPLQVRKWNGTTGGLLWEHVRNVGETVEYDSRAYDVAVDGNGDVVVAGSSRLVETTEVPDHYESYTAKLSGSTGALLWQKLFYDAQHVSIDHDISNFTGSNASDSLVIEPVTNAVIVCCRNYSRFFLVRYASLDGATLNEVFQQLPGRSRRSMLRQGGNGALYVATPFEDGEEYSYGVTAKFASFSSASPLQTLSATHVTATSARLNGVLTPGAVQWSLVFEWGIDPIPAPRLDLLNPWINTTTGDPPFAFPFNPATPFSATLGSLQPHTTYHFRARSNFLPSSVLWGKDLVFTTQNRMPVAAPDSITVSYESWMSVLPLNNDSEPDGDPITMTGFYQPWYGSVVRTGNTFTYTAPPGFTGIDQFTYTIEDGFGGSAEGTVTITVQQTYNAWSQSYNLTGLDAAPGADPNQDGIKNIQAFLHGIPPTDTPTVELMGRLPQPGMLAPVSGPPCFTYTFYQSAAAGVHVAYEASETLTGTWTPITPTYTTILWSDPFTGDRIIRVEFCLTNGESRKFVRMALTAP